MITKIRNIEDLKREKRLLKLEMEATERLIVESFHVSKENLMHSAAGSFFSLMKKEPIGVSDVVQIFANPLHWWQRIVPLMPLVLKLAGNLYKRKKRKKNKDRQLQSGEMTLRRVAS